MVLPSISYVPLIDFPSLVKNKEPDFAMVTIDISAGTAPVRV
jgi:hypothetical protein